ncbi:hypothetical protein WJX74_005000 [Apatococcus lobatus]|uniref:Uncharacterized protein n=1 Tax=Apatococcus lobatus TaxID=904363 RepID=A0AAW1RID1_9CHLO
MRPPQHQWASSAPTEQTAPSRSKSELGGGSGSSGPVTPSSQCLSTPALSPARPYLAMDTLTMIHDVSLTPGLRVLTSPRALSAGAKSRSAGLPLQVSEPLRLPRLQFSQPTGHPAKGSDDLSSQGQRDDSAAKHSRPEQPNTALHAAPPTGSASHSHEMIASSQQERLCAGCPADRPECPEPDARAVRSDAAGSPQAASRVSKEIAQPILQIVDPQPLLVLRPDSEETAQVSGPCHANGQMVFHHDGAAVHNSFTADAAKPLEAEHMDSHDKETGDGQGDADIWAPTQACGWELHVCAPTLIWDDTQAPGPFPPLKGAACSAELASSSPGVPSISKTPADTKSLHRNGNIGSPQAGCRTLQGNQQKAHQQTSEPPGNARAQLMVTKPPGAEHETAGSPAWKMPASAKGNNAAGPVPNSHPGEAGQEALTANTLARECVEPSASQPRLIQPSDCVGMQNTNKLLTNPSQHKPFDASAELPKPNGSPSAAPCHSSGMLEVHLENQLQSSQDHSRPASADGGMAQGVAQGSDGTGNQLAAIDMAVNTSVGHQQAADVDSPAMRISTVPTNEEAPDGVQEDDGERRTTHVQSQWESSESQQPYCTLEGTQAELSWKQDELAQSFMRDGNIEDGLQTLLVETVIEAALPAVDNLALQPQEHGIWWRRLYKAACQADLFPVDNQLPNITSQDMDCAFGQLSAHSLQELLCSQPEVEQRTLCLELHGCVPEELLHDSLQDSAGAPSACHHPQHDLICDQPHGPLVPNPAPPLAGAGQGKSLSPSQHMGFLSQGLGPHTQDLLQLRLTQGLPDDAPYPPMKPPPPRKRPLAQSQLLQNVDNKHDRDALLPEANLGGQDLGFVAGQAPACPQQATGQGQKQQTGQQGDLASAQQPPLAASVAVGGSSYRASQQCFIQPQPGAADAGGNSEALAPWMSMGSQAAPLNLQLSLTQGFTQHAPDGDLSDKAGMMLADAVQPDNVSGMNQPGADASKQPAAWPCHGPGRNPADAGCLKKHEAASDIHLTMHGPALPLPSRIPLQAQDIPEPHSAEEVLDVQQPSQAAVHSQSLQVAACHMEAAGVSLTMNPAKGIAPLANIADPPADHASLQPCGNASVAPPPEDFAFDPPQGCMQSVMLGKPGGGKHEQGARAFARSAANRAKALACGIVWEMGAWSSKPLPGPLEHEDQNQAGEEGCGKPEGGPASAACGLPGPPPLRAPPLASLQNGVWSSPQVTPMRARAPLSGSSSHKPAQVSGATTCSSPAVHELSTPSGSPVKPASAVKPADLYERSPGGPSSISPLAKHPARSPGERVTSPMNSMMISHISASLPVRDTRCTAHAQPVPKNIQKHIGGEAERQQQQDGDQHLRVKTSALKRQPARDRHGQQGRRLRKRNPNPPKEVVTPPTEQRQPNHIRPSPSISPALPKDTPRPSPTSGGHEKSPRNVTHRSLIGRATTVLPERAFKAAADDQSHARMLKASFTAPGVSLAQSNAALVCCQVNMMLGTQDLPMAIGRPLRTCPTPIPPPPQSLVPSNTIAQSPPILKVPKQPAEAGDTWKHARQNQEPVSGKSNMDHHEVAELVNVPVAEPANPYSFEESQGEPELTWAGRRRVRPKLGCRSSPAHPHRRAMHPPQHAPTPEASMPTPTAALQTARKAQHPKTSRSPGGQTRAQHVAPHLGKADSLHAGGSHHHHHRDACDDGAAGTSAEQPHAQGAGHGRQLVVPAADTRQAGAGWRKSARAQRLREVPEIREESSDSQYSEPESARVSDASPAKAAPARHRKSKQGSIHQDDTDSAGGSDVSPAKAARARHRRTRQHGIHETGKKPKDMSDASPAMAAQVRHRRTWRASTGDVGMQRGLGKTASTRATHLADSSDEDDHPMAARPPRARKRPVRFCDEDNDHEDAEPQQPEGSARAAAAAEAKPILKRRRLAKVSEAPQAEQEVAGEPTASIVIPPLGCSKCRKAKNGCGRCRSDRADALKAAGRGAEAAEVLALKPGQSKKQRRASAPPSMATAQPEQPFCHQAPPLRAPTHHLSRRQSHPAGRSNPHGQRSPCGANTAHASGPTLSGPARPSGVLAARVQPRCPAGPGPVEAPEHHASAEMATEPGGSEFQQYTADLRHHPSAEPAAANGTAVQKRQREQLQEQLPPRRSRLGRADCQAVLKGVRLMMTGSGHSARAEAERLASCMGATILSLGQVFQGLGSSQLERPIDMLITNGSPRSAKYLAALTMGCPVLDSSWLQACQRAGKQVGMDGPCMLHASRHWLKPLTGLRVSLAGKEQPSTWQDFGALLQLAGAELHLPAGVASSTRSKKRKCGTSKGNNEPASQPDMILTLEPIDLLEASLSSARVNKVPIRDTAWLLCTLKAGQMTMNSAEDADLVQKTQLGRPAEAVVCPKKPPQQIAGTEQGSGRPRHAVPCRSAACASMLGSLIADSQEDWHASQDIIGEPLHREPPKAWPDPLKCHDHQAELSMVTRAGPSATAIAGPGAEVEELEWIGSPQEPPPHCGLQATEMRKFFGAFRKGSRTFALGDCARLVKVPGNTDAQIVKIEALWTESASDSAANRFARCKRFLRAEEIGHKGKSSPSEVFLSDEMEPRVHLAAVDKPCTVLMGLWSQFERFKDLKISSIS